MSTHTRISLGVVALSALALLAVMSAYGFSSGVIGYSGNPATGGSTCNGCHTGGVMPTVVFSGPTTVAAGETALYSLVVSGGQQLAAGLDVSVTGGALGVPAGATDVKLIDDEITHATPKCADGNTPYVNCAMDATPITFTFEWTAPMTPTTVTLYGAGNSVNLAGGFSGDAAGAAELTVNVIGGAGVTIAPTSINATEGGANGSYAVVLESEPTADVTVSIDDTDSQIAADATALTFTPLNWDTPQTVTVVAVDDGVAEGAHSGSVTHTVTSADAHYDGIIAAAVTVHITDNDSAGVAFDPFVITAAEGGATGTYTVVLTTQPAADVVVTIGADSQIDAGTSSLTFTPGSWDTPQTVTVTAVDDQVAEGDHTGTISHSVSSDDADYDGYAAADVTVQITDNDVAGVSVSPPAIEVSEAGATAVYTVVLTSEPVADVTVSVVTDGQVSADPTSLLFTAANRNVPQTVTIGAVDDAVYEPAQPPSTITHAADSADPNYQLGADTIDAVEVTVVDNDYGVFLPVTIGGD